MTLHPRLEALLSRLRREPLALDRASVRSYDADGRLHVERTPISKANVCEYWGREIPNSAGLGLKPDQKYKLLRHPDELRKAVDTFNNLPLLDRHVPVDAWGPDNHKPETIVGSTGTDAAFEHPYLVNSLVVWAKDHIDGIENDRKKELSCAYRYRADMTPGEYEGEPYDGVMRDIVGNHVALVVEGRAGPDVVVGDAAMRDWTGIPRLFNDADSAAEANQIREREFESAQDSKENLDMTTLTRKAAAVLGGLAVYLGPKLAQDARFDRNALRSAVDGVTRDNFAAKRPAIAKAVRELAAGKLAKDQKLDDLDPVLLAMDAIGPEEAAEDESEEERKAREDKEAEDKRAADKKAKDKKARDAFMKACDAKDWKAARDACKAMDAEEDDDDEDERPDPEDTNKGEDRRRAKDAEEDKMDVKKAMDEAIAGERARQRAVREAERFVAPWVGNLAIAYDSAEDVYKAAIEAHGKKVDGVHPSAYRAILEMIPKPGQRSSRETRLAHDGAPSTSFAERFPDAGRIRIN